MYKRYGGRNFYLRKQHYRAKHAKSGMGGYGSLFFTRFTELFKSDIMRSVTVCVGAAMIIMTVFVVLLSRPAFAIDIDTGTPAATDEYGALNTDPEMLAGLRGEGLTDDTDSDGDMSYAELLGEIGVVFDDVSTKEDITILQTIEKASKAAIDGKKIGKVRFYNSKGDINQQIQDMRSMINSNVKSIIIYVSDKDTYLSMTALAKDADIPVIAINAPAKEGFEVNITGDNASWGQKSAEFLNQNIYFGNYLEIYENNPADIESKRINLLKKALNTKTAAKSLGSFQSANTSNAIKNLLNPVFEKDESVNAVVSGYGMAKNVLGALLSKEIIPKVFLGDATAGFIKLWHDLKTDGVKIERKPAPEPSPANTKKTSPPPSPSPSPSIETVILKAGSNEVFCAEASPYGIGGTAFQFALRFNEGRRLLKTALKDKTYKYTSNLLITNINLEKYYEMVKDEPDDYLICDWITDEETEAMFTPSAATPEPAVNTTGKTASPQNSG